MKLPALVTWVLMSSSTFVTAQDPDIFEILEANRLSPWRILGPFPGNAKDGYSSGLSTEFINEAAPDFDKPHKLAAGTVLHWTEAGKPRSMTDGVGHGLNDIAADHDTVYLARTLTAIADHEAVFALGFDDSAALWLNGTEVFRKRTNQGVQVDKDRFKVQLRKGENRILFKVVNNRGNTGFAFRITDQLTPDNRWGAGLPDDGHTSYAVETVPVPTSLHVEVGGLLFLPDKSLLVSARRGQIFQVHNPDEHDAQQLRITTFAEGLHEPLGMLLDDDGSILVSQIPELTRLRDTDGDGRADEFETIAAPWGLSGNYHEYHFGPVRDGDGNLWGTLNIGFPSGNGAKRLYRGSAYRVTPSGRFEITCYGLRSPNGVMADDAGEVFYTDNQGEWMDVCRLAHLQPKHYYGHKVPLQWSDKMPEFGWREERTLPAVWYPYHLMRSTSQPVVDRSGGKFGPYAGQIIVGDQNNSLLVRTTLERVNGVYQGACYPFWQGFAGGINRLAFDDHGVLYVGLTNRGWGSVASEPEGLQRIRFTGATPFDLLEVNATKDGFDLHFTKPIARESDLSPRRVYVREYGYKYWSTYGSGEFDSRRVEVLHTELSEDRTRLSLRTDPRNTGKAFQITLRGGVRSEDGEKPITQEAFYTLLEIPR